MKTTEGPFLRPLLDKIVVQRGDSEGKTAGGIVIPDIAKEKLTRGVVIAVGPGAVTAEGRRIEPGVKPGDKIVFGKYSGNEFEWNGLKGLLFMREDEIYAVEET